MDWFDQQELINKNLHIENLSKLLDDDLFLAVCINEYAYMAEVLEVMGKDTVIALIKNFGGVEFRVPTMEMLAKAKRDFEIYTNIPRGNDKAKTEEAMRRYCQVYGISMPQVRYICNKMASLRKTLCNRQCESRRQRMKVVKEN